MAYTNSNKRKLLQGASALILGSISVGAVAETVTTTVTDISVSAVDASQPQVQTNSGNQTTNANSATYRSNNAAIDASSVRLDISGSTATAKGNNAAASVTDPAAAELLTTYAVPVVQTNSGNVTATANSTDTSIYAYTVNGSTMDVTGNNNLGSAQGNSADSSVALSGYAANSTEAGMVTLQSNTGDREIYANAYSNDLVLDASSDVDGSSLTIVGNSDRSTATGNSLTQQMVLGGTSLDLGTESAAANTAPTPGDEGNTAGTADINAAGAAVISSSQMNDNTDVRAETADSALKLNVWGHVDGSVLDLSSNIQDATAAGSSVGNAMTLSGTTVGTGAVIVSSQTNRAYVDENDDLLSSNVTAFTGAKARISADMSWDNTDNSTVGLTNNKIQSRATGGSVSNTMSVSATTVTLQEQDATQSVAIGYGELDSDLSLSGYVSGAYSTLNDQLIEGDIGAATFQDEQPFYVEMVRDVVNSTINNDRNTLSAQAQAAVATNTTTLTVSGSFTETGNTGDVDDTVANAAVIANIQEIGNNVDVEASVDANSAVLTTIGANLIGSTSTASANKVQAFAEGATATNALAVSARTLNVADDSTDDAFTSTGGFSVIADTAFAVANRQDGGTGTVSANLFDSVMINTAIGGVVFGSSVASTGNMQDAFASSNKATNTLSLSATTLSGDAGVGSNQISEVDVSANIGGSLGEGFVPGDVGENAGVIVSVSDDIIGSSVAVTGNMVRGSAISNSSTNSLTVAATTLSGDGDTGQAHTQAFNTRTTADYGLGNNQETRGDGSSDTNVVATFGIEQAFDRDLSGSSLSVSNNTQFGEALGNTATNRVALTGTDVGMSGRDAVSALNNNQLVDGATIDSQSDMTVYANVASDGSSIALNGNTNTALGVSNNASNTMAVTGVTMDGWGDRANAQVGDAGMELTADAAVANTQKSEGGAVNSTALTTIYNQDINDVFIDEDPVVTASAGLLNSTVTMSNNVTTAEASANRALNSLAISATDIRSTAAVGNVQQSSTSVSAVASQSTIKMELDSKGLTGPAGANDYVASGSTVTMANNTTTALARGNAANNTLNYTAGATYDAVTQTPGYSNTSADAAAVVLNNQTNTGAVSAAANQVQYRVALNDGADGLAYGPLNSSVSVTGNAVTAVAFGNTATNALTMSTFGAGIPSSVNTNVQYNTASVTATAGSAQFVTIGNQTVSGSAIRNSGNSVSAQAIGNNSVSTISGGM